MNLFYAVTNSQGHISIYVMDLDNKRVPDIPIFSYDPKCVNGIPLYNMFIRASSAKEHSTQLNKKTICFFQHRTTLLWTKDLKKLDILAEVDRLRVISEEEFTYKLAGENKIERVTMSYSEIDKQVVYVEAERDNQIVEYEKNSAMKYLILIKQKNKASKQTNYLLRVYNFETSQVEVSAHVSDQEFVGYFLSGNFILCENMFYFQNIIFKLNL